MICPCCGLLLITITCPLCKDSQGEHIAITDDFLLETIESYPDGYTCFKHLPKMLEEEQQNASQRVRKSPPPSESGGD